MPRDGVAIASGRKEAQIPIAGIVALVENSNQNDPPTLGSVNIDVSYAIPIQFPLFTFNSNFTATGTTTLSSGSLQKTCVQNPGSLERSREQRELLTMPHRL